MRMKGHASHRETTDKGWKSDPLEQRSLVVCVDMAKTLANSKP